MKYKKKPVVIDVFQFGAGVPENIEKWAVEAVEKKIIEIVVEKGTTVLIIHTLEGDMRANKGDYIIRGVNGEIYPCKSDIFEKTYARADGLTECCETCKHYKRGDISHLDRCNYGNEFIFHPSMPRDKMKCDEWEAKAK